MELKEFLFRKPLNIKEMAKICGVTPPTIHGVINRTSTPSLKVAIKIYSVTDGIVSFEEMLSKSDLIEFNSWRLGSKRGDLEDMEDFSEY